MTTEQKIMNQLALDIANLHVELASSKAEKDDILDKLQELQNENILLREELDSYKLEVVDGETMDDHG